MNAIHHDLGDLLLRRTLFKHLHDIRAGKAIHTQLYGVMAQMAHRNTVGLRSKKGGALPMLSAGSACLRGVTAIARKRVVAIPPAQLLRDLYTGGSATERGRWTRGRGDTVRRVTCGRGLKISRAAASASRQGTGTRAAVLGLGVAAY